MKKHTVPEGLDPRIRLDRHCADTFEEVPSRAFARKLLRKGLILLNGEPGKASRFLHAGDSIELLSEGRRPAKIFELQLTVLYEDDHMAVVNKPPGFPTSGATHKTLENALPHNLRPSPLPGALRRPRVVHRLDFQTAGLVICAKTGEAHMNLGHAFERREVSKVYRALVLGRLEGEGEVHSPVEEREASSAWTALEHTRSLRSDWLTTVELRPLTGRTHQLRRHMASLGHPILGDCVYGVEGMMLKGKGLFLCAMELSLAHPMTGEPLVVRRREPRKFGTWRDREALRWSRYHEDDLMLSDLRARLEGLQPDDDEEALHLRRMRELLAHPAPFSRATFEPGHFTASSFVLSPDGSELLLIHHAKLKRWLQPGGHVDPEDSDIVAAARRELQEEAGLSNLELVGPIFDVDVHSIPPLKGEPAHEHFDVRFLFRSTTREVQADSDAEAARWVRLEEVGSIDSDRSVMRAVEKLLQR